ncbi:cytochrome-c peroxidase [Pseudobacteriovorax antillogorgiicola]|uniref:Cytochrome c peroxidase n=1 Tax=Pseudobacteriovorax antillogorgiicola TaxID=1513793 RepID=A0A1Y6CK60_9BACT|nr:cytochrome c peroxidase [Pseudobacteriovorax antillogorgiicola]TCS46192.1 cytochrome c peroxidase [Pseudobacteriovorax antillogorgiicola]SMF70114.1 cytochrome c peroxidase [Pseudobacteriovorax antillogorgiicola]
MVKVIVSIALSAILIYTGRHLWMERNAEFPFESKDYILKEPTFEPLQLQQGLLGFELFRDQRLSKNGQVACISCHKEEFSFGDNQPQSMGLARTALNSPPLINLYNQRWFFWDGRADSLAAQALQPIEHPEEHGIDRRQVVHTLYQYYRRPYEHAFQTSFPQSLIPLLSGDAEKLDSFKLSDIQKQDVDEVFSNFGRALEQYQRGIVAMNSPFDKFMRSYQQTQEPMFTATFGPQEWRGFQLFLSKTKCNQCHSGALFTDQDFHFTSLALSKIPGRDEGLKQLLNNPFKCLDKPSNCLDEPLTQEQAGPFRVKTPTLRNLTSTAPYFHDGSAKTIREILYLYNRPEPETHADERMVNLYLTVGEIEDLEAFLFSLSSPVRDIIAEKRKELAMRASN